MARNSACGVETLSSYTSAVQRVGAIKDILDIFRHVNALSVSQNTNYM